jgi:hypothetical protein
MDSDNETPNNNSNASSDSLEFYCQACQVKIFGQRNYNAHLAGRKHLHKVAASKNASFQCKICNIECSGLQPWKTHIASKKHLKKVQIQENWNRAEKEIEKAAAISEEKSEPERIPGEPKGIPVWFSGTIALPEDDLRRLRVQDGDKIGWKLPEIPEDKKFRDDKEHDDALFFNKRSNKNSKRYMEFFI